MDKKSRDYVVCLCEKVTRGEIEDYVRKTGISDLKELCEKMNIGTKCGGCRLDIEEIMNEVLAEA